MNTTRKITSLILMLISFLIANSTNAQNRQSISVISIDTKDLSVDNISMANLVRLELEKTNTYEVLDRYDVADIMQENGIDINNCFGKSKLVKVGKLLHADKMLTGSAEKFGEKIILILRMVDVATEKIEKTDVMEYLNQESEIQIMVSISVNNILAIENDELMVDLLVNYDRPISSPKTSVKLNGPRMGATFTMGRAAKRLQAAKSDGGFNMYPISSMFGYQYEFQYLSSGDFQALVEVIGTLNNLESGKFIPSLTLMNGFRFNKTGWELGLGPVFRGVKTARGYWDDNDEWHLESELDPGNNDVYIEEALDNRGTSKISTGLIIAVGRTFHSGYLNMPVNIYFSPKKDGNVVGLSFGFNVAQKPKFKE
jgi:hypothetical protein